MPKSSRTTTQCCVAIAKSDAGNFSQPGVWKSRFQALRSRSLWLISHTGVWTGKRLLDLLGASCLLLAALPVAMAIIVLTRDLRVRFSLVTTVGKRGRLFQRYTFAPESALGRSFLRSLPALCNVIQGEMSLVGPRPLGLEEAAEMDVQVSRRYEVRPGLVCLWWIRRRANIAFLTEGLTDVEYIQSQSVRGDLGIILRAVPGFMLGRRLRIGPELVTVLGIRIDNLQMESAVATIMRRIRESRSLQVCFVNADCVNIAFRRTDYKNVLQSCELVLADGIGIRLASMILKSPIRENVNGTDLFPHLCKALARNGIGLYLLGGRPGVPEAVAEWTRQHFPGIVICGTHHGYFDVDQDVAVVRSIAQSGAGVVLVAMGAPQQDLWIHNHLPEIRVPVAIGVGGLFDFYSGRIPRAPIWIRELGMEWLYRFSHEPTRMWRRYFLGNFAFVIRVLGEHFRGTDRRRASASPGAVS